MTNERVSIIIPAYNSGKYIEETLNNLFSQTYQDFEIIVAYDEKSNDNTLDILKKFEKNTDRLIVDIGVDTSSGCARNRGFKFARGKYVVFVDADDQIHPNYLETMVDIFHQHPELDVVCCDRVNVLESTIAKGWEDAEKSSDKYFLLTQEQAFYDLLWQKIALTPWVFMVRRQYMIEKNISFPNYSLGEDIVYAHKLISNTQKIGRSLKKNYIYILHKSSVSHQITPENRWNKYDNSRHDVVDCYGESNLIFCEDFMTMNIRNYVYASVLLHDFSGFIDELTKMGINKLNFLHKHDKLPYTLSVICFRLSKKMFYYFAKFVGNKVNTLIPVSKEIE